MQQKQLSLFINNHQPTASKNKYSISPNNPIIWNTSFSFFPIDDQFYQNISVSNFFSFNNCAVHFHMNNQVKNVSSSVDNPKKRRRIIYSRDLSQEKWIIKNWVTLLLVKHWFLPLSYEITNKYVLVMLSFRAKVVHFTFYIVMVFQSGRKFWCWFQKNIYIYLWKLLLAKMSCSIFPSGYCGLSKSIQIS